MFLKSMEITASALTAQRTRMDVIMQNLSNKDTTRTESGQPYQRQVTVFTEDRGFQSYLSSARSKENAYGGVKVTAVIKDDVTPFIPVYDPSHPDADETGYYYLPNVDETKETLDYMAASNSYTVNLSAMETFKQMCSRALEIGASR